MKKKPTYEELEKRVNELEQEKQFEHDCLMGILESIPYCVYIVDRQYNIQYINKAIEKKFGQVKGRKCYTFLHNRKEICPWCKNEEVFSGKSIHWDWYSHKTNRHYDVFDTPLKNLDGRIFKLEIFYDITLIKQTQAALKKNVHDLKERIKELNCLFGLSALAGKKNASLADIYQGTVELLSQSMQYPEIACVCIRMKGNEFKTKNFKETIWKETIDIIVNDKSEGVLLICYLKKRSKYDDDLFLKEERALFDSVAKRLGKITERKNADRSLLKSEQRFRDLMNNSPTGITIIQGDKVVYRNMAQKKLAGCFEDPSLSVTFKNIHPNDAEMVDRNYQRLVSGEKKELDMEFRFFPVENMAEKIDMKCVYCMASIIDYHGKDAILLNMMDVTLAKEIDHILRIQDKMASLGRVAAGIAHEIRNPLSGINIYLKTLVKLTIHYDNDEKIAKILSQLQLASNKIESVIKRVMDFSRPGEPKLTLGDINQAIKEAIVLSSATLRKHKIRFSLNVKEDLPKCRADLHMIEQIILNLIDNAAQAMQQMSTGKRITISSFHENGAICIRVSDSGPGIPESIINNIFDPFYTTKSHGSGIGLSICHRIITDHGGSLHVKTAKPSGAEFTIRIPLNP